jgi:hypothetical protein
MPYDLLYRVVHITGQTSVLRLVTICRLAVQINVCVKVLAGSKVAIQTLDIFFLVGAENSTYTSISAQEMSK